MGCYDPIDVCWSLESVSRGNYTLWEEMKFIVLHLLLCSILHPLWGCGADHPQMGIAAMLVYWRCAGVGRCAQCTHQSNAW